MLIFFNVIFAEEVYELAEPQSGNKNIFIIVMLVLIAIMAITLLICSFFMRGWMPVKQSPQSIEFLKSKKDNVAWKSYQVVPSSVSAPVAKNTCTGYDGTKMPVFSTNNCSFGANCGFRVFVLARYGRIEGAPSTGAGSPGFRCTKFAGNTNSFDGYITLYGNAATVNSNFQALKFCQNDTSEDIVLLIKAEEVDLTQLSSEAIKPNEDSGVLNECAAPTTSGQRTTDPGTLRAFTKGDCTTNCEIITNLDTVKGTVSVTTI